VRWLLVSVAVLASCLSPNIGGYQELAPGGFSKPHLENKVLTAAGKITLKSAANGEVVFGTIFPIHIRETRKEHYVVYCLTAAHVVEDVIPERAEFYSIPEKNWGISNLPTLVLTSIKVLYVDSELDVALLKVVSPKFMPVLDISDRPPKFREKILAAGCPFGEPLVVTEGTAQRKSTIPDRWMATAQVLPGNSGGPVISAQTGKVLGITTGVFALNNGFSMSYIPYMHEFVPSYLFYEKIISEIAKDLRGKR
tara:strand:+ start:108 stop:866 length:759 start_codon:yes stop_codon:yes gene_type:complete